MKVIVLPKPVAGAAKITVSVFGQFQGEKAGAGLVYGYQPDGGYYAFVVTPNKGYALYRGGADGLRQISKGTNNAIQVSSVNRLSAELERYARPSCRSTASASTGTQPRAVRPCKGRSGSSPSTKAPTASTISRSRKASWKMTPAGRGRRYRCGTGDDFTSR